MPARTAYPPPVPTAQPDGDARPQSATEAPRAISPVEIAREAYARYLERGRADGHDVEDWLAAEESLRQRGATRPADRQEQTDIRSNDERSARRVRESEDIGNA